MDISTITSLGNYDPAGANAGTGTADAPRDAGFQKLLGRLFDDLAPKARPMERPTTKPPVAERPAPKPQAPERPEPRARAERPEPKPAQPERPEPNRAAERGSRPGATAEARSRPTARTTQTERNERTEAADDRADETTAAAETDETLTTAANTEADTSKADNQDAASKADDTGTACEGGMPTAPLEAATTPTEPDLDELLALLFAADTQTADAAKGAGDSESPANAQSAAAVDEDHTAAAEQAAAEAAMAAALAAAGAKPIARNGAAGGAAGDGQRVATPTGPGAGDAAADAAATTETGATDAQAGTKAGDAQAAADFAANLADVKAETRADRTAGDAVGAKAAQSTRDGNGEAQAANANGAAVNGPAAAAASNAPTASQGTGNAAAGNENALRAAATTETTSTTSTHHTATGTEGLRPAQGQDFAQTITALRPMRGSNAPQHPGAVDQVTVQLQRGIKEGNDRIALQLRPEELGRIDILLEFGADGRVAATVQADRAQTLELLQRDSRNLERALQDAGLKADAGSLSFNLRGDNHPQNQRADQGHDRGGKGDGFGATLAGNANEADGGDRMAALNRWIANPGRLDVRI